MTVDQKNEIKELMQKTLSEAQQTVEQLQESVKSVAPDNAIGRVSRMDAIGNKAMNEMALEKAKNKIEHLEYALGNWNTSEFACCQMCMQEIGYTRLKAMPHVETCMNCAY